MMINRAKGARVALGGVAMVLAGGSGQAWGAAGSHPHEHPVPSVVWSLPFAAMLLAIAVFPLVPRFHHWWEQNRSKFLVGLILGTIVLGHYLTRPFGYHEAKPGFASVVSVLDHAILRDYIPFMVLLFSLYVVAGGLRLTGDLQAKPWVNTAFLGLGALLASVIGTTGASMVLIRPLLQTNQERKHVQHTVVFFIFLVSNIGGCLLPLGDPPLFLGYLQGVPFLWTVSLIGPWAFCVITLLVVYFIWDKICYRRESVAALFEDKIHREPLRIRGMINIMWLIGIVLSVALIVPGKPLPGTDLVVRDFVREAVMLVISSLSLATTPRGLRKAAEFSYGAILEVACLFLGIFITMQVPLEILHASGADLAEQGLARPFQFFWATGLLSSVLDNAPTYLVFLETAKTLPAGSIDTIKLLTGSVRVDLLTAISLGAVFMGANTYIGNGPNFMVKSIAEGRGIKMPGFFGYMIFSGLVLIPLFIVVTLVFFS